MHHCEFEAAHQSELTNYPGLLSIISAAILVASCAPDRSTCVGISRDDAIELAIERKRDLRLGSNEQPKWESSEVVELQSTQTSELSQIVATVTFAGDGIDAPLALVYGDCYVGWSIKKLDVDQES